MTAPRTKLDPLTVSLNEAPPAVLFLGERVVRAGTGLSMANGSVPEAPPPGPGLLTETWAVPAVAISAAVIAAVTCPALTKVVVRADPFHSTGAPLTSFPPFTVSVNAGPPAVALFGARDAMDGTGLFTVKVAGLEV